MLRVCSPSPQSSKGAAGAASEGLDTSLLEELESLREQSKRWAGGSNSLGSGLQLLSTDSVPRTPENASMSSRMALEEDEEVESEWRERVSDYERQVEAANKELVEKNAALASQQALVRELKSKKRAHRRLVKDLRARQIELQAQLEQARTKAPESEKREQEHGGEEGAEEDIPLDVQAAEVIREKEEALEGMVKKMEQLEKELQEAQGKQMGDPSKVEEMQVCMLCFLLQLCCLRAWRVFSLWTNDTQQNNNYYNCFSYCSRSWHKRTPTWRRAARSSRHCSKILVSRTKRSARSWG